MTRHRAVRGVATALVCAVLCAACCCGCEALSGRLQIPWLSKTISSAPSDRDQIAGVLDAVAKGIEVRGVYRVLAHVSKAFHDKQGRDYPAVQRVLRDFFRDYRNIRVQRATPRIVVRGAHAEVMETFVTAADPANPAKSSPFSLERQVLIRFEKKNNHWLVTSWENP